MRILSVSSLRLLLALLVSATALAAAAAAPSSPSAVLSRACTPQDATLFISILGNRAYGWRLEEYKAIPAKVSTILVWSMGGPPQTDGVAAYGWAQRSRAAFSGSCATGRAFSSPAGSLRAPVKVKDGWFFGRKYRCYGAGRFVVSMQSIPGGKRVTVRVQKSGKLLAVGEIKGTSGWLRGSKSCDESER
jgi:hypothetical protein